MSHEEEARLVSENMGLVYRVAHSYERHGPPFEDLVQEGTIGLLTAIRRFDPSKGSLSNYATLWILSHVQRACGRWEFLAQPIERDQSPYGMNRGHVDTLDLIPDNREADPSEAPDLGPLLRWLPEKERRAVTLYYGLDGERPHTHEEVGAALGCTYQYSQQLISKAHSRLLRQMAVPYED